MKLNFNRNAVSEVLNLLTLVVPSRTPKPILRCVHIAADQEHTRFCATDLELGINYLVREVKVDIPGSIVIPADSLAGVVRESSDEVLALEAHEGTCKITGADSNFTIYGQEASQFPVVPCIDGDGDIQITLGNLQSGIEQCLFATAKESTRYALNGVLWEIKGKKLSLVATDGRRLARSRVDLLSAPDEKIVKEKLIVPAKTMALLARLGGEDKDTVKVSLIDNQLLIGWQDVVISSGLIEGNFPKYEDIIPKDYDKKLTLPTEGVLSAVRRAALLTSEESKGIKIKIEKGSMVFSGSAPETGDAQVQMSIDYKAEPIEIGFNPQFLIDALRVIRSPQFELELGQPDRPGLIKCGANLLYVLMPINIS